MSKDILYKPSIENKKSYYTEGTFDDSSNPIPSVVTENAPTAIIINNLLNTIDNNLKWIPQVIKETYLSPYIALQEEYSNVAYDITEPDIIPDPTITSSTVDPDDDFPTDPFVKGTDIFIDITDPLRKKSKVIGDKYRTDFLDIYKDYLEKLNKATQSYMYTALSSLDMSDKNHNLESYSSIDIINKDLLHVTDFLTKSSISFDQTIRLHKKLFDMDATILHVRGIKLAEKLIERYYEIDKLDNDNDLALTSNVLLLESKKVADKKYKENFYTLYKYLNSSVILMNESTQTLLKQNKSVLTINKYEERGN